MQLNKSLFPYSCEDPVPLLYIKDDGSHTTRPWRARALLESRAKELVAVLVTADGGGMMNVIDLTFYLSVAHLLGDLGPSKMKARIANGTVIRSRGRWVGAVHLGEVTARGGFEVFDSRGSFEVLLGKPWLREAGLSHDFTTDELTRASDGVRIPSLASRQAKSLPPAEEQPQDEPPTPPQRLPAPAPLPAPRREDEDAGGPDASSPHLPERAPLPPPMDEERAPQTCAHTRRSKVCVCECLERTLADRMGMTVGPGKEEESERVDEERKTGRHERRRENRAEKRRRRDAEEMERLVLENAMRRAQDARDAQMAEALAIYDDDDAVAEAHELPGTTPLTDVLPALMHVQAMLAPAKGSSMTMAERLAPERVQRVLDAVQIGADLSASEREQVRALVREFADVFTLSVSEVRLVDFIQHKLGIPAGTQGPRVAHQKPLTEPQREWLYAALDEMEDADIVRRIPASAAKWVSAIKLAPKDSGEKGLTMDELRRRANVECIKAGVKPLWDEVDVEENRAPNSLGGNDESVPPAKAKWRLCHNFIGLNRVSAQNSFPMGDLESKQRRASGHRYVSVADFQAGFNAIAIAQEDIAYTAFAVPGRGMYVTPRMCFGLTGAPNTFCEMVAHALDGLSGDIVEPWVDDCAMWGDSFEEMYDKLRRFLTRCRERTLSLSAVKTHLFQAEAMFAGARISASGVKPGLAKIAAILDWPQPQNALEVLGFTGLTGHFRAIIKDYARIARPLTDLTRDVRPETPKGAKVPRGAYRRALERDAVGWKWGLAEQHAFVTLKTILTTEPVLKPPQYDRPFIVTTDGSKVGFGATLTQRWTVKDKNGVDVEREFPVAYASKRTSRTEERYSPYLLEFAALKFAVDKFDKFIFGQPIELVTDCKALRDTLSRDDLSSTHTRWMESIIARRIVDVRHRPGVDNQADGLSRKWISSSDRDVDGGAFNVAADWEQQDMEPDVFSLVVDDDANARLRARFADDIYFRDIVEWLTALRLDPLLSDAQARRARDFMVHEGKLWRVGGKHAHRAPKVECVPLAEGRALAAACHANGHWGRDVCEEHLRTRYFWPNMRRDIVAATQECSPCKAFGTRHIASLLEPITRSQPFQMVTADYLSMPVGKGKYKTILLFVDVFSRYVWGYKTTKKAGTGAYTVEGLRRIKDEFMAPELFATDGGSHFDCAEVHNFCAENGIEYTKTPPYSPWANGLVEECNRTLLGRLRRYCQPDFAADETGMSTDEMANHMPTKWPDYFARAIADMNSRILPSLGYAPRELLLGFALTDVGAPSQEKGMPATAESAVAYMARADTMRADGHARAVEHAAARKRRFDEGVQEVVYEAGDFVQVYNDRLDSTHSTERKLAAKWSGPMVIVTRYLGSWRVRPWGLTTDEGDLYVSGRRLRRWTPARGSEVERAQKEAMERRKTERAQRVEKETEGVEG